MDLELTRDQLDLQQSAEELLDARAPLSLARAFLDGEGDASSLWAEIEQLGWYGIGLDEDDPFGVVGLCILAEACGAHAAPVPLVDTAVAARVAASTGSTELARVAGGEVTVSLGVLESKNDWALRDLATTAVVADGDWLLDGSKLGARHAASVSLLAVVADTAGDPGLFFLPPGAVGCTVVREEGLDASADICRIELEGVHVERGFACMDREALDHAFAVGAVATAAEAVGAASQALDLAVAYSLERRQFGRAVGGFQALQHVIADLHILRESARATVYYAAASIDDRLLDARETVSIAKAYASQSARTVVHGALQVLGGVAFTWEHDVHLLQRRVLDCERRFGDALHHERIIADALLRERTSKALT